MRVLILSLGQYNGTGGVNTYINLLKNNMGNIDFHIHSLSDLSTLTSNENEMVALFKQKMVERFARTYPPAFINFEVMKFIHKIMLSKMEIEKFDLVHSQNGVMSSVFKEIYPNKPMVGTIHGSFYNESILEGWVNNLNEANIFKLYDHYAFSIPDSIITVTKNIHVPQEFREHHFTIYNGVNLNLFTPIFSVKNPIKIITSGRLTHLKGYDILMKALIPLQSQKELFKVIICGEGPEQKRLEMMAVEHELPVHFRGHLSKTDLAAELSNADLFVQPSRTENFPFSVLEAMASGCIPIVSTVGGMTEQVEHTVSGFTFESENADELSKIIKKLIANTEILVPLKKMARTRVEALFSLDKMVSEIELIYRKTVKDYKRKREE